ncbi:MAG TPA: GH-E family nuclease [Terriglobia bacterium]|nr:GH-E family nuclease [Terriglobia bacterium]
MAGQRRPGPQGLDGNPGPIDEGTLCRAETPPPGPIRDDHRFGVLPVQGPAAITSLVGNASAGLEQISHALADFRRGGSWATVQPLVFALVGPQTFGLGVIFGMGENVVGGALSLAQLAKTLLLADLYDRAHQPSLMAVGPLGLAQRLIAEVLMREFRYVLEEARAERDALIAELAYAIAHPLEVLGHIGEGYAEKWRRFETLSTERKLSSQFQAGRIVGEVLMDVLAIIGAGAAVVKAASKIPRLARLARGLRGAAASGLEASSLPKEVPATRSPIRPAEAPRPVTGPITEEVPAPDAPATKPRPASLREKYMGRTPGKGSKTGLAVQERMRAEGKLRVDDITGETEFRASNGKWYPLRDADMTHKTAAVSWWNETGRHYGAQSPEVRQWMLDPDNYTLDHYSLNRSAGATLGERYLTATK